MTRQRSVAPVLLGVLLVAAAGVVGWLAFDDPAPGEVEAGAVADAPRELVSKPSELAAPRALVDEPAPSRPVEVAAPAPLEPRREEVSEAAQLELADALWVEGVVRLPAGAPADEVVEVIADGRKFDHLGDHRVRIDEHGRFRVAFHPKTRTGWLKLDGRYCYLDSPLKLKPSSPPDEIVLEPLLGGCIAGRIAAPANEADVAAAIAKARVTSTAWTQGMNAPIQRSAEVREDLSFELRGIPPHLEHDVQFDALAWVPFAREDVEVEAGKIVQLDIACTLGARLSGRVVDKRGEPVGNAEVTAAPADRTGDGWWRARRQVNSSKTGEFTMRGVTPGKVRLSVERHGYLDYEQDLGELLDGQVREGLEIVLESGDAVAGVVKWNDGQIATTAFVTVKAVEKDDEWFGFQNVVPERVDENGRFHVSGLGKGPFIVMAEAPEGSRPELGPDGEPVRKGRMRGPKWRAKATDVPAGAELELVLQPGHSIEGVVLDDLGAPVPKFTLTGSRSKQPFFGGGADALTRSSGDDGRFELEGLDEGSWWITANASGFPTSAAVRVEIPYEGEPIVVTVPRPARVSGVVVDASGAPVAKASVSLDIDHDGVRFSYGRSDEDALTDAEGRFTLDQARPGAGKLIASHANFADSVPLEVQLAAGSTAEGLRIVLTRGGELRGRIHESLLEGGAKWSVNMGTDSGSNWKFAEVDSDGTFRFERLTPGDYRVHASLNQEVDESDDKPRMVSSTRSLNASVRIEEGETSHVVLGEPSGVRITVTGRVTLAGRPLEEVAVSAYRKDQWQHATTDENGAYTLVFDGDGDFTVNARTTSGVSQQKKVEASGQSNVSADFEFPAGRIAGRVIDAKGESISGAWVNINGSGEDKSGARSGHTRTERDGAFDFQGLSPGDYTISVQDQTAWSGQGARFGATSVDGLRLEPGRSIEGVEIRVEPPSGIVAIVRASDGSPAIGAEVVVRLAGQQGLGRMQPNARTDGAGRATTSGLSAGEYFVIAHSAEQVGLASGAVRLESASTREVSIDLRRGGWLSMIVENKDGEVVSAKMNVSDSKGVDWTRLGVSWTQDKETKAWKFGPLPAGAYRVSAGSGERASPVESVNVSSGEVRAVRMRLSGD